MCGKWPDVRQDKRGVGGPQRSLKVHSKSNMEIDCCEMRGKSRKILQKFIGTAHVRNDENLN